MSLAGATATGDVIVIDSQVTYLVNTRAIGDVPVVTAPEGEPNKTLRGVEQVILDCNAAGLKRGGRIIAVGGGLTQDLVTAAASFYMRGVPWILVPTTWLSIMDSCIGGKSAINVGSVKNLAGNFNPPQEIWIDLSITRTLPETARAGGLAEGVKIAYCAGPDTLQEFLRLWREWDESGSDEVAYAIVGLVLKAKADIVERDEFDTGDRLLLNLGHTFAHALEVATKYQVSHGQAVALGVLAASALSPEPPGRDLLDACVALAQCFPSCTADIVDWNLFERAIQGDKKHTATEYRLIVPIGPTPRIEGLPRTPDTLARLQTCMTSALNRSYGE
ncbi:MAG: 3-dehydroquinate synthase [Candidatus Nanopelagicales bacterium]|nr:3-dehydroquinate synthase [Candidatus Nanopelagicales bacterium]